MSDMSENTHEMFSLIGKRLKTAREEQGVSLEEIATRTRIGLSFLKKIEEGNLEGLPASPFVKGFVRNYQQVVGLDEDEQLNNAITEWGGLEHLDKSPRKMTQPSVNVLETEETSFPLLKLALIGLICIMALWVGYMLISSTSSETEDIQEAAVTESVEEQEEQQGEATDAQDDMSGEEDAQTQPEVTDDNNTDTEAEQKVAGPKAPVRTEAAASTPSASSTGNNGSTQAEQTNEIAQMANRNRLKLTIRGLEKTWVRLSIDRGPPIDVMMNPAETVGWEANHEFLMTVGRSNGVAVYLNGEDILLPSEPNQLVQIKLDKLTLLRLEN